MDNASVDFTGIVARYVPSLPGPLGCSTSNAPKFEPMLLPPTTGLWFALAIASSGSVSQPSGQSVRMARIALAAESNAGDERLVFKTRDEAGEAAARLVEHPSTAARLRELGGVGDTQLVAWTTAQLYAGDLKVLLRVPAVGSASAPASTPRSTSRRPPSPRPRAPAPPSPQTPEYSTFPPDLDGAAVAETLKQAATDGVPFCEECMKAAEAARNNASPVAA